jgi:GNAT superfamily N-acetyltransferase
VLVKTDRSWFKPRKVFHHVQGFAMATIHGTACGISFHFEHPEEISEERLARIERLILDHGAVGHAFVRENLRNAFLIGYAMDREEDVIGTVILKRQKEEYRRQIEAASGLDLSGYLERGYTSIIPKWRGAGIAGKLISGLVERSRDQRVYVTIGMDNTAALKLTAKNGMSLAGSFINERTGRRIGVFVNR